MSISIFTGPLILRKFLELLTYQFAVTLTSAASDNAYINITHINQMEEMTRTYFSWDYLKWSYHNILLQTKFIESTSIVPTNIVIHPW